MRIPNGSTVSVSTAPKPSRRDHLCQPILIRLIVAIALLLAACAFGCSTKPQIDGTWQVTGSEPGFFGTIQFLPDNSVTGRLAFEHDNPQLAALRSTWSGVYDFAGDQLTITWQDATNVGRTAAEHAAFKRMNHPETGTLTSVTHDTLKWSPPSHFMVLKRIPQS